ncbi:hypothetical protein BG004_005256 [Podila humilis]|nr:hypothetical protein BG004_005256 [Podila humilis]
MKRLPFGKGNKSDKTERPKTNRISPSPFAQSDSKDRTTATTYLNLPDAAPALPPLQFGLEGATANTFDLGEMLVETENKNTPLSIASSIDLVAPRSTPMDSGFLRQSHNTVDTYRQGTTSIHSGHYHRLDTITELGSSTSIPKQLEQEKSNHADNTKTRTNAEETIRDLRMELAKYNPMSPLLHGAPQQEYGLLIQRTNKLKRQYCEMEEALETMLIEKDLLAMDLKAMEDAIGSKEFDFVGLSDNGAKLPQRDPGFRCRKDAYQTDVRELRDQKAQLKDEIEGLKGQREEILNEMQILSTRNMDLSAMNDTLSNEQQMHRGSKRRQSYASSVMGNSGITNSFAEKIRRPRLQAQVPDSTTSSTWRLSTSDDQDDDASTRRTNWRKSTMKPVMGISAMIGKMMADIPSQTGTSSQTRAARGFPSQSSDGVSEGISSG